MSGGARPGAGRKPGSTKPESRRQLVAVRLSSDERAKAEMIGNGNASAGLRTALASYTDGEGKL